MSIFDPPPSPPAHLKRKCPLKNANKMKMSGRFLKIQGPARKISAQTYIVKDPKDMLSELCEIRVDSINVYALHLVSFVSCWLLNSNE